MLALVACAAVQAKWEPTAPVEFVVPAGKGGGADQMARFIHKLVTDHHLMIQPLTVVNMSGDSGVEGLLHVKAAVGNPHKLIITLSNLFTAPLATGVQFHWQDITPVQMLALDEFVLWVNADSPYKSAQELLRALRNNPPNTFKLAGTGTKQEDQLVSVLLETAGSTRIAYVSRKGGGGVAKALVAREADFTVNNPIEAEKFWREGAVRPLCVFDGHRMDYPQKMTATQSWADVPTCMSAGIPVEYLMMRAIFTTPGAQPDQVAYYIELLDKVRALPEWKEFMARGAFRQTVMSGAPFNDWLDRKAQFHKVLMREAKLMYRPSPPVAPAAALPAAAGAPTKAPAPAATKAAAKP